MQSKIEFCRNPVRVKQYDCLETRMFVQRLFYKYVAGHNMWKVTTWTQPEGNGKAQDHEKTGPDFRVNMIFLMLHSWYLGS